MNMKRQKNYRQLRSKSAARNRLNEIKLRTDATVKRQPDATVQPQGKSLFDEIPEKPDYSEPPEDRFSNMPLPDFQFKWDEEFFGIAQPDGNEVTETFQVETSSVAEKPETSANEGINQDTDSLIEIETSAVNISETVEPAPFTIEIQPDLRSSVAETITPARFVSVKRRKAIESGKNEKTKKTLTRGNTQVQTKTTQQKTATGISKVETKSGPSPLNVRHTPSFRSFVISTIRRLMEEQRFFVSGPESSRFLFRELETGKTKEPPAGDITGEIVQVGATRWNKPFKQAALKSLANNTGAKPQKSYSVKFRGERSSLKHIKPAGGKSKSTDENYKLNIARFNLMEAMINARAISSNMKMKW
jgi:hypothetical protein